MIKILGFTFIGFGLFTLVLFMNVYSITDSNYQRDPEYYKNSKILSIFIFAVPIMLFALGSIFLIDVDNQPYYDFSKQPIQNNGVMK